MCGLVSFGKLDRVFFVRLWPTSGSKQRLHPGRYHSCRVRRLSVERSVYRSQVLAGSHKVRLTLFRVRVGFLRIAPIGHASYPLPFKCRIAPRSEARAKQVSWRSAENFGL